MSEKRLINWDSFYGFITSIEMPTQYTSSEINQLRKKAGKYWDGLPKPTLPDVIGTRTLDSMTEEEFVELMKIAEIDTECLAVEGCFPSIYKNFFAELTHDRICTFGFSEHKDRSLREFDVYVHMGIVYFDITPRSPVKVVRWFLEKGFNVFGEGK